LANLVWAKDRHSEGPLWYRVRVSDWRTFAMTAPRYGGPKPLTLQTVIPAIVLSTAALEAIAVDKLLLQLSVQ